MKTFNHTTFLHLAAMLLFATAAHACPNCFASSKTQALQAYYVSIVFMACIPFGMVTAMVLWLRQKQQQSTSPQEFSDSTPLPH